MTVHVGQITSEVAVAAPPPPEGDEDTASEWDERERLAATLERLARDRLRTATGGTDV